MDPESASHAALASYARLVICQEGRDLPVSLVAEVLLPVNLRRGGQSGTHVFDQVLAYELVTAESNCRRTLTRSNDQWCPLSIEGHPGSAAGQPRTSG